jgi:hypothetical protein
MGSFGWLPTAHLSRSMIESARSSMPVSLQRLEHRYHRHNPGTENIGEPKPGKNNFCATQLHKARVAFHFLYYRETVDYTYGRLL